MHHPEVIRECVEHYFRIVRASDTQIRELENRIDEARKSLEMPKCPLGNDGGGTGDPDKIGAAFARIEELENKWAARVLEFKEDAETCRDICDAAHPFRFALYMNRVEGRTWTYAARVVNLSESHVKRKAGDAMREIYYLMPERYRREPIPNAMPK